MTRIFVLALLGIAWLTGCTTIPTKPKEIAVQSTVISNAPAQQSSYELGLLHIKALRDGLSSLDQQTFERGLRDALDGKASAQPPTLADWQTLAGLGIAELKTANVAAGKLFLDQNKLKQGVVTLPSGLQYQVLKEGKGDKPRLRDTIGILYTINGLDGKNKVDTMIKGKSKMYEIKLEKIISKGWQEALQLMPLESKWRLYIPGELAFGEKGMTEKGIMPNETLVIDTYLLEIK